MIGAGQNLNSLYSENVGATDYYGVEDRCLKPLGHPSNAATISWASPFVPVRGGC